MKFVDSAERDGYKMKTYGGGSVYRLRLCDIMQNVIRTMEKLSEDPNYTFYLRRFPKLESDLSLGYKVTFRCAVVHKELGEMPTEYVSKMFKVPHKEECTRLQVLD